MDSKSSEILEQETEKKAYFLDTFLTILNLRVCC